MSTEIDRTRRGFSCYSDPLETDYGHILRVRQSSAAFVNACWLFVDIPEFMRGQFDRCDLTKVGVHLDEDQVRGLRDRLDAFLKDTAEE